VRLPGLACKTHPLFPCFIHSIPLSPASMPFKDREKQREASRRHYAKHRERVIAKTTENNKVTRKRRRAFILDHLRQNPCVDCGETDPIVLEFDHVGEEGSKDFNISDAIRLGYGLQRIIDEIAKCQVRCANCHRKRTYERAGWGHKD